MIVSGYQKTYLVLKGLNINIYRIVLASTNWKFNDVYFLFSPFVVLYNWLVGHCQYIVREAETLPNITNTDLIKHTFVSLIVTSLSYVIIVDTVHVLYVQVTYIVFTNVSTWGHCTWAWSMCGYVDEINTAESVMSHFSHIIQCDTSPVPYILMFILCSRSSWSHLKLHATNIASGQTHYNFGTRSDGVRFGWLGINYRMLLNMQWTFRY